MCIIIDANTSPHFKGKTPEAQFVVNWIIDGKGTLETGGRNLDEIRACPLRNLLQQFLLAGRVRLYRHQDVIQYQRGLDQTKMESDDPHILALALVSGCRLLFSHDKNLHKDFTGKHFLSPRGKVFQDLDKHKKLLKGAKKVRAN